MTGALYLLLETDDDMDLTNAACRAHGVQVLWLGPYEVTPCDVRLFGERVALARVVGEIAPLGDRLTLLESIYDSQPPRESKRTKGGA